MITPEYVRGLIEHKLNGIDITIKSKKGKFPFYRYVAFALCKIYGGEKLTLQEIGDFFGGRSHATVLHGFKKFNEFKYQNFFSEFLDLYDFCVTEINKELKLTAQFKPLKTVREVEDHYRIKHIKLVEKSNYVIECLTVKLKNLRHRPIFEEIAGLSDGDLADFEARTKAFLQMKRMKNK